MIFEDTNKNTGNLQCKFGQQFFSLTNKQLSMQIQSGNF